MLPRTSAARRLCFLFRAKPAFTRTVYFEAVVISVARHMVDALVLPAVALDDAAGRWRVLVRPAVAQRTEGSAIPKRLTGDSSINMGRAAPCSRFNVHFGHCPGDVRCNQSVTCGSSRDRATRKYIQARAATGSPANPLKPGKTLASLSALLAATNKCLAESNKSPDGPVATKKRAANR